MKVILRPALGLLKKSYASAAVFVSSSPKLYYSVASTEARPERISKNLSFRAAYDSPIGQDARPLVLLYGWLVAKSKHIHKYGDFYLKKGFDVLHVKVKPLQLMWPVNAQAVVQQVVDFTQQSDRLTQPLLVHGFSVGGYLYGETLVKMLADPAIAENIAGRLKGQILDSPVDFDRVPLGVSRAVTNVPVLQEALRASLTTYLRVTRKHTTRHYDLSSNTFKANDFRTPTLFMYSKADVIGIPEPIEAVADGFRSRDIDVYNRCFAESIHVSHFMSYPVEYITTLNSFLTKIRLLNEEEQTLREKISATV